MTYMTKAKTAVWNIISNTCEWCGLARCGWCGGTAGDGAAGDEAAGGGAAGGRAADGRVAGSGVADGLVLVLVLVLVLLERRGPRGAAGAARVALCARQHCYCVMTVSPSRLWVRARERVRGCWWGARMGVPTAMRRTEAILLWLIALKLPKTETSSDRS